MRKFSLALILFITTYLATFAQNTDSLKLHYNYFSQYLSPEKLYFHIDRNIFAPGETIWFKAYLENKSYLSVMPTSNLVYVELLSDTVVSRIMLKKGEEGFSGHMLLPEETLPGEYILRAYTNWNRNMPAEYMFYSKIRIVDSKKPAENESVQINNDLKIDFYPESGRYFSGMMATIAFKSNFKNLTGFIQNSKGEKVADFCTEHEGMGKVMFFPLEGERYFAKISSDEDMDKIYELPEPSSEGGMINIKKSQDAFIVQSYLLYEVASLIVHNGSEIYYCKPVGTGSNIIRIEEGNLARGINHVLLISSEGKILAERQFFVYENDNVAIDLNFNKDIYNNREKVTVSTILKDINGRPVAGEFSVSVIDGNFKYFSQEDDIESYMLISSELKGKVNNPGYYFDNSIPLNERLRAVDLLMMVQGWRYYDITYLFSNNPQVKYGKEYTQSVSGFVKTLIGGNSDGFSLVMFAPKIDFSYQNEFKGSNFYIDNLDFPDGTPFLIQTNGKMRNKSLTAHIDRDIFAPLLNYAQLYFKQENVLNNTGTLKDFPIIYNDSIKNTLLKEVFVTAKSYYIPKHNPSPFGQSFERKNVKERYELKVNDNKQIQDYLTENYPGFFKIEEKVYSKRSGSIKSFKGGTVISNTEPILYVDGVKLETTFDLKGMRVSDIETLVVLMGNDGALYRSNWGVILISTRRGNSEIGRQKIKSNGIMINPLGWQKPSKFYSPIYDTPEMYDTSKPDYRTTIYWNPSTKTDERGLARFEFYTSDYKNPCIIRIEGKTSDNRYISKTTYLKIE
ncbi:MAG: hypothetical protein AB9833_09910 [Bacteroidales bacterium]